MRKIKHGLEHPDRAVNFIFGGKKGKQKTVYSFITDYDNDKKSLNNLSAFLEIDLTEYYEELIQNQSYKKIEVDLAKNSIGDSMRNLWLSGFTEARLIYTICRALKPEIVIETGVASGLSSYMILLALEKNNKGHLFSIDLPLRNKSSYPPGKGIGWIVPDELNGRWTLKIGDSKELLPKVLDDCKECDLFLHDSLHTFEHMKWEFEKIWPFLRKAMLSDDIYLNNAFDDFRKSVKCKSQLISKRMGIILRN